MRKVIVMALMIVSASCFSMSFGQAKVIFAALSKTSGLSPKLVLSQSSEINAYEYDGVVEVNSGMLRFVRNSDELAVILGHEIGHYALHHTSGSNPPAEYAADMYGAKLAARAGFNRCRGALVILRFYDGDSRTHPASAKRYSRIKC